MRCGRAVWTWTWTWTWRSLGVGERGRTAGEVVAYVPDQCVLVAGAADVGGVALVLQVTLAELHQARVGQK